MLPLLTLLCSLVALCPLATTEVDGGEPADAHEHCLEHCRCAAVRVASATGRALAATGSGFQCQCRQCQCRAGHKDEDLGTMAFWFDDPVFDNAEEEFGGKVFVGE